MNSICCISYLPLVIIFPNNNNLNSFNYVSNSLSYYKIVKENIIINSIIQTSQNGFFLCSKNSLQHYEYKNNLQFIDKIYTGLDIIKNGIYDIINKKVYCFTDRNLYIICHKNRKRLCTFHNIRNIPVDKYRYYSFSRQGFLNILKYSSFCVFSTKNQIKRCIELIWNYKHCLNFYFHNIHNGKYIFSLKDQNSKTELIIINSSTFLVEILDLTPIIGNNPYNLLFDNYLYIITFSHNNSVINMNYYRYDHKIDYLFSHDFYFPDKIKKFKVYSFYYYNIFYINNKVHFLFNIYDKISNQLITEIKKNINIEKQLQYYHNILSCEIKKIENDISTKHIGKCCICYENNVNIIFFPCSHICCCSKCINIDSCPICREFILYKKFCYILTN